MSKKPDHTKTKAAWRRWANKLKDRRRSKSLEKSEEKMISASEEAIPIDKKDGGLTTNDVFKGLL